MRNWESENPETCESLWDFFSVPTGMDKDVAINSILSECAELELLYTRFETLRAGIGTWTKRRLPIWEKLYASTQLEYDPIENYDRKEDWTDITGRQRQEQRQDAQTSKIKGTTDSSGNSDSTTTRNVLGYDGGSWTGREQDVVGASDRVNNSSSQDTTANINGSTEENENVNVTRTGRAHGNIGVTTTQKMIEEERDVVNYDIYQVIVQDFQNAFCLMVW